MAITAALGFAEADTAPADPEVTTATLTTTSGRAYVAYVLTSTDTTTVTSVTGCNMTWTQRALATRSGAFNLYMFTALADGSSTSTALTVDKNGAGTGQITVVVELAGIDTSAPFVQYADDISASNGTQSTLTLASFADATNNAVVFAAAHATNEAQASVAGYSEYGDVGHNTPTRRLSSYANVGEDTTPNVSWTTSGVWGTVGLEARAASAAAFSPVPPNRSQSILLRL